MSVNQGRDGDEDEQATNGYSHWSFLVILSTCGVNLVGSQHEWHSLKIIIECNVYQTRNQNVPKYNKEGSCQALM
jgi:hypothetical protein